MAEGYLRRKIDAYLVSWRADPNRKPLIVRGARQVGKTESILHFAKEAYRNVVYINFVEEPKYKLITEDGYNKSFPICRTISYYIEAYT
uniref:AAA family ATPase n=1 Tax=uncultured Acetatifactor sp. TaxID=1671927 RepID=UPI00260BF4E9